MDFFPEVIIDDEKRMAYLSVLKKDDAVRVEGKPELRLYLKKDGTPGVAFEIRWPRVCEPLVYLGDRVKAEAPAEAPPADDMAPPAEQPY